MFLISREDRNCTEDDSNVISTGASGFGIAGLIVAMDRGFITREQGIRQLRKITDFLSKADRYHGAWPHWLIDETGKTKAFSRKDNGGEIVSNRSMYGLPLVLKHNGAEEYGGPLFWSQYSYIGLNPKGLSDQYADYWELNCNHAMIDYIYCVENPKGFKGYGPDCWGLTASYSTNGYDAHMPGNDKGVISPTAALSSFPYTPEESMAALRHFYFDLGDKIWGKYGFYDAFSESAGWYPPRYLGLDQLTIAPMIENHRSGLLWNLFMSCPEIQTGLDRLGFKKATGI